MRGIYVSQADEEVFRMVNRSHGRCGEGPGAEAIPAEVLRESYDERMLQRRCAKLKRITNTGWRAALGFVFLGAIFRELIAPGFGALLAACCFVWAWLRYQKEERYA